MRALPYALVALAVLAILVAAGYLVVARARTWRDRRAERAPWTHYCRPDDSGAWQIGVERRDGVRLLDEVLIAQLPADVDEVQRLVEVDVAKARARAYNSARDGM